MAEKVKNQKGAFRLANGEIIVPKRKSTLQYVIQHKWLYLLLLPGFLYFILFRYIPMGGLVIAFKEYSPFIGIWDSPWVGFQQFTKFFSNNDFTKLLVNTLGISLLQLVFYFPAPIILSLFLNEVRHSGYKRLVQTLVYIPHFVSWVIVASLTYQLFNVSDGVFNVIYKAISGGQTFDILQKSSTFWGLIVGQDIWRETGYGTIVFLAALSGVDQELYEAARVDGAGRWRLMWHITLPAIRGTIVMMLIMRVGGILNTGYEQIFLMRNDLNLARSEVFDTYIYQKGLRSGQYSFSSAAGMFKSVVGMIMVLTADRVAKLFGESGLY
ncbi:MAG: ABC transporter permease subunit [Candidatus Gastranaerophilales bacterium]|nr:ABC transporter permease subunit [Candidatus Gastranaerophilales bacterium]